VAETVYTEADLAKEVLQELRIVRRSGGVPNAADAQKVLRKYRGLRLELEDRGKAFWEANAIPERIVVCLTELLAGRCAQTFGVEYDAGDAFQRLIILCSAVPTGYPTKAVYF
jgi:hypothetical protein